MTTDSRPPASEPEYVSDEVVSRETTEAYTLDVWTVSGHATPESRVCTYGRTEGLYKLSPNDNPELVEAFDDALDALEAKYGAVDEFDFTRIEGDAYEIMVTVVDSSEVSAYDSEFDHSRALVHVMEENDAGIVESVDDAFDTLREQVSDE